jgi:hypothetical protein
MSPPALPITEGDVSSPRITALNRITAMIAFLVLSRSRKAVSWLRTSSVPFSLWFCGDMVALGIACKPFGAGRPRPLSLKLETRLRLVLIYRWAVFLLAAGYCLRMVIFGGWEEFAGPFRFLTVWALFASFFCASRMIAREEGRTDRRWDGVVGMTAVLNLMVVFLYWRLYFGDPASVTRDGNLGAWWLEGYLHGLGPLLQWVDALFIHRSFRRPLASAGWLMALCAVYFAWIEGVVRPLADSPVGAVTDGLPYRFLNDLEPMGRVQFYVTNAALALVVLALFCALAWLIRRALPRPEAR